MKRQTLFSYAILRALLVLLTLAPTQVAAQDYQMYETQYLRVLPGHAADFTEALTAHNQAYHAEGAYLAQVYAIITGPKSGQFGWVMGPGTLSGLDARPSDQGHGDTWANEVLAHAVPGVNEYWVLNEEISYAPASPTEGARDLHRISFFEVEDNALFVKVHGQIAAVMQAAGSRIPRAIFRTRFATQSGRDWAMVTTFENWTDFEAGNGFNFRETWNEVHGADTWATFMEEVGMANGNREDEWRQRLPELGGSGM